MDASRTRPLTRPGFVDNRRDLPEKNAARGFTMIEILLVLALSFIGLLGLLAMQVVALRANVQSRSLTEATALAQDKLEALRRVPVNSLAGSMESKLDGSGLPLTGSQGWAGYTRQVQLSYGISGTAVQVTVSWNDTAGKAHAVTVQTVRSL